AARDELAEALGGYAPELTESLRLNAEAIGLDADRLRAASVERSPELSAARYGVLKKRAEAKAAAFAWLPSVGIKAGAQLSGEAFPLNRATWSVGLSAEFSSPFLSGALGASVGAEPPLDTTARSSARIQPLGDPARALGLKGSLAALRLEEERYASLVAKVERSADAAVLGYRSALRKRDIGAQALSIAESRSSLVALKVELGQATRFEAVEAELHRAGEEIGLVEAAHALLAAERRLERLLDLPPDCLAAFMEAL
ncbi:MAG: TolC family protein, partial [Spirochaetes bacterium]|nr:TolC family protein [Spirochaetota bacterium]